MIVTYKTVKKYEQKPELTQEQQKALEEYIETKKQIPCTKTWHKNQLSHAEEVLYKHTREEKTQ